jgi:hypothetical protein
LADGDKNVLRYTAKDVQTMMKNPKACHLGEELNRNKICYFIDKYVTRLYGSRHIQSWAAKNKNRTIFDLIKMSDLACTVAVIENSHEIWEQNIETNIGGEKEDNRSGKENKKNHQRRRHPSSRRELGKRENITRLDGIIIGYISSTRFAKNGRN